MDEDLTQPRKIPIWSKEDAIPFEKIVEKFRKEDNLVINAQSKRFTTQKDFNNFCNDLEDVMRKHGVYVLSASIFADL